MGSQPFLGQRAGCQGAGRGSCAPPPRVPRRPALPEPRSFRTGQGGGAELGRKVSPTPALAPATGIPAPPRGGKRGPGPGDRPGDRLRAAHVQAESACPGALGASSAARPHRRRGARRPQPACPESGLAGASSRGRAGTPVGAGAREKARGPEDRPARTPEPRGRRPARLTPVSGPQPARSRLRLGAAAVQVKEGSSGLRVGPGPPHPSPLQPHWEDRFPQPPLVSGGDLSPSCPGAALILGGHVAGLEGCCDGTDGHVGSSWGPRAAGNGAGASRGSLCWCVSLITAFKRLKSDCLC